MTSLELKRRPSRSPYNERMCGNLTRNRASLLLEVARMYWDEGLGQTEIARRTGYSRPTISRMLAEARRVGVVTVTVAHPIERLMALEKRLVDAFGLKTARVSEATPGNGSDVGPDVARTAADLLLESCGPHSVIAVSNGRAVAAVVHHTPERSWPSSTAVAMLGSVGESFNTEDGPDVCRNLSLRLGGRFRSLTVPLVFDSLALARAVREEDQVATTLELAARSDIALTGVGTVGTSVSPLLRRWMTPEVVRECRKRNVVRTCAATTSMRAAAMCTPPCATAPCASTPSGSGRSRSSSAWPRVPTRSWPSEPHCAAATCPPWSPTRRPRAPS